jgi:hypothetical protein
MPQARSPRWTREYRCRAHQIPNAVHDVARALNCTHDTARLWLASTPAPSWDPAIEGTGHWANARSHASLINRGPVLPMPDASKRFPLHVAYSAGLSEWVRYDYPPLCFDRPPSPVLKGMKRARGFTLGVHLPVWTGKKDNADGATTFGFHLPGPEPQDVRYALPPNMPCESPLHTTALTPGTASFGPARGRYWDRKEIAPVGFTVNGVRIRRLDLDSSIEFGDDTGRLGDYLSLDGLAYGQRGGPRTIHARILWDDLDRFGNSRAGTPELRRLARLLWKHRDLKVAGRRYGSGAEEAIKRLRVRLKGFLTRNGGSNACIVGRGISL